jgi:hypothetical protein
MASKKVVLKAVVLVAKKVFAMVAATDAMQVVLRAEKSAVRMDTWLVGKMVLSKVGELGDKKDT